MQAIHAVPDGASIRVRLEPGEALGTLEGPATIIVPADPANAEYQALQAGVAAAGLAIGAFAAPARDRAGEAQAALQRSDVTLLRCYEAGLPVPEAWRLYRAALRALVGGGEGPLPPVPPYPDEGASG